MIRFVRAHGSDAGPTQRPLVAGALGGLLAAIPAGAVFYAFGSFQVVADEVIRISRPLTVGLLLAAFLAAGIVYGGLFQRAANDRRAGWMLGLAFGFLLWIAAPIVVLPLLGASRMAAGLAATGFLATFLVWGLTLGLAFPFVHRPLHAGLDSQGHGHLGPDAVGIKKRLLRRPL